MIIIPRLICHDNSILGQQIKQTLYPAETTGLRSQGV